MEEHLSPADTESGQSQDQPQAGRPPVTTPTEQNHNRVRASSGRDFHAGATSGRSPRADRPGLDGRGGRCGWFCGGDGGEESVELDLPQACDPALARAKVVPSPATSQRSPPNKPSKARVDLISPGDCLRN